MFGLLSECKGKVSPICKSKLLSLPSQSPVLSKLQCQKTTKQVRILCPESQRSVQHTGDHHLAFTSQCLRRDPDKKLCRSGNLRRGKRSHVYPRYAR
ncbi:hypothetical protein CEXT_106211 [Caerostris extrusa]|uniref:Uncharacterized protein n=1 Tax=Caerostris extrusa TaxID=172846 RepID=A0AAV4Y216_CAEEX|nr:hypothetical protein CEXT_106211 [Caerostris extrusa]